ncbi:hypothetical protein RJ640_017882 [Escallonia rubra]|uniref:Protein decapping 5 n=1 Tax=Escallonia rubra TaxID=112253 RepID=A0AA88QR38_9ASTE|nr:hypothetical protein RJ640_017882 [Escallonia rubra]
MALEASRSSSTADSYIGSLISLTSKSEIRYEGVLYNINTDESSIGLRNVRSFGTEGRKKEGPQVLPSDKVYEYILFRGSDIKDLQVKSSPPVQTTPPITSDPAIIQSHYPRPPSTSSSLPAPVSGSLPDVSPHTAPLGHPGSTFQGGLPLYQPGGNLGSWGPSPPPNANGVGLTMPMYWPGFYGPPNGLPQMHQSLLRPPGLSMPPSLQQPMPPSMQQQPMPPSMQQQPMPLSMQQQQPMPLSMQQQMPPSLQLQMPSSMQQPMQYSGFNASLPTGASSLPEYPSPLLPISTSSLNLTSTSLPASTLPSNIPPMPPATLASEILPMMPTKAPNSVISTAALSTSLPSASPLLSSSPDVNTIMPSISNKPNVISGPTLTYQPISSIVGASNSAQTETPTHLLVTPGQLLRSKQAVDSSTQASQMAHKDVEVVLVSPKPSLEPPAPVSKEAQPPILPLPPSSRPAHKLNGAHFQPRQNYRGRERGRGVGSSRPLTKFTEDFDFMAMNEKFKKDEVWGHLGKSNKSNSKEKEGVGSGSDEDDFEYEDDGEVSKVDTKPVYNKDDFFDSLSCNALDNQSSYGRTRFSEQMKIDTETFGEFSRYRGGRGGRGPGRGGGRFRGSYYGRGYGYLGRGRGRSTNRDY